MEREGHLDNSTYIAGLAKNHPLKSRENVFTLLMACASLQILQMLALTIAPLNQPNPGKQLYHFVGGFMEEPIFDGCNANCLFPRLIAYGDSCDIMFRGVRIKKAINI